MTQLVVVSAGVSNPSSSRMLADRIAQKSLDFLKEAGSPGSVAIIELAPLAVDIARATVSGFVSEALQAAIERVAGADGIVASTPIYKAGISGLFKSFVDVLDDDLVVAKPVLLVATAGTARHALVIDDQMRPLFAYMRALTLPTSVFAASEDWGTTELGERIERAATELAVVVGAGVEEQIADRAWSAYQHQFAGNASRAASAVQDVDFDSPLMRLAAGGAAANQNVTGVRSEIEARAIRPGCRTRSGRKRQPAVDSAPELRSKLTSEPDRRFDLHSPDRDAFHVDSKRHAEPAAVRDQLGGGRQGVLIGGLQRVGSVREVILDPSRHLDT